MEKALSQAFVEEWSGADVSVAQIESRLAALRHDSSSDGTPYLRTSVLTHLAWVPEEWEQAATDVLEGLAERHPSRVILLLPRPDERDDRLDAQVSLRCFALPGQDRSICSELIELRLAGRRTAAPASIAAPLLITDLPAFLRWRGQPPFGDAAFEGMIDLVDRLVVDSAEWDDLPEALARLRDDVFDRVAVSDIAWARGLPWRIELANLWPDIGDVRTLEVAGPYADALLLAGWLRSRLGREVELEHEDEERLTAVSVDGREVRHPHGADLTAADLLSEQLDQFTRDRVYESAVAAAAG